MNPIVQVKPQAPKKYKNKNHHAVFDILPDFDVLDTQAKKYTKQSNDLKIKEFNKLVNRHRGQLYTNVNDAARQDIKKQIQIAADKLSIGELKIVQTQPKNTNALKQFVDKVIKRKEKEQLELLRQLNPNFEAIDEQINRYKPIVNIEQQRVENERRIKLMSPAERLQFIKKTTRYQSSFEIKFFHDNVSDVMKHYQKCFIKVTFMRADGTIQVKIWYIESGIIKNIIQWLDEGRTEEEENTGSGKQMLYDIMHAISVEIITDKNFKAKSLYVERDDNNKIIEVKQKTYKKNMGDYFNYINKIPQLNLSRYQIGNDYEQHIQLSQKNCFIHCVEQSGIYDNDQVLHIIGQVNQEILQFSLKNIKELKNIGHVRVCVITDKRIEYTDINTEVKDFETLNLCLYKNHYFLDEPLEISKYWIEHYNQYAERFPRYLDNMNIGQVEETNDGSNIKIRNAKTTTQSNVIIRAMMEQGLFEEIEQLNQFNYREQHNKLISAPQNAQQYCHFPKPIDEDKEVEQRKYSKFDEVYFADFESFTVNEQQEYIKHDPFLLCYHDAEGNRYQGRTIFSILNKVKFHEKVLVYFHNLSYDNSFITRHNITTFDPIIVNGQWLQFKVKYENCLITFRDTNRIYGAKLSKLPEMFFTKEEQTKIFKEIFPYEFYTLMRYLNNVGNIDEACKYIGEHTRDEFVESLKNAGAMISDTTFDMQKYAEYYCHQDCFVLQKCTMRFRELLMQDFGLELFDFISISSLALQYQINEGCFKGCAKVNGPLRRFLQQFIIGGRTMTKDNEKQINIADQNDDYEELINVAEILSQETNDKCKTRLNGRRRGKRGVFIQDFDAVSLYPTAQKRSYYPKGKCYTMSEKMIKYYNNPKNLQRITEGSDSQDLKTLYMELKITKGRNFKARHFPLLSKINKDGVRYFSNDVADEPYYFDHVSLQDLIKFQGYEYQILSGVYFMKRNYKINEVISKMFTKRLEYKEKENPLQAIYKLMLNSSYGKTAENIHDKQFKIYNENEYKQYIFRNYNVIDEITVIGDKYLIKENVETFDDQNYNYIGVSILSMSKRIMNEVMCLAEDLGIDILYQDTDSMHIEEHKIDELVEEYDKLYHKNLLGKGQGQFHCDFESDLGKVEHAVTSIFLGKKCYIDVLKIKGTDQYDYHIRMKGISHECLKIKAIKDFDGDLTKLYTCLYEGNKVTFNLCDGKVMFKRNSDLTYQTLKIFERTLQFIGTKQLINATDDTQDDATLFDE